MSHTRASFTEGTNAERASPSARSGGMSVRAWRGARRRRKPGLLRSPQALRSRVWQSRGLGSLSSSLSIAVHSVRVQRVVCVHMCEDVHGTLSISVLSDLDNNRSVHLFGARHALCVENTSRATCAAFATSIVYGSWLSCQHPVSACSLGVPARLGRLVI